MIHPQSLGAILRMERFKRNLTQEQVCEALKMNIKTLCKIENNKSVSGKTIKRLMDFYDLTHTKTPLK